MIKHVQRNRTALANRRSGPSLEEFFFKNGGFTGAIRRIVRGWERPFTLNQLKVELHRRHPKIIPAEFQVEDIVEWFVFSKQIECLEDGSYRRLDFRLHFKSATVVKIRKQKPQLVFTFK